ncbi:hypothetical protein [Zavarzinella formosa]|uniref:hypothetical protein n=1 Tax=Zavarzinella formosa TaxID=360055 RepID=UPI00035C947E|nr:hypothetical protein [Zavarzinella formosa]
MRQTELDGNTLWWRGLLTRRFNGEPVSEIVDVLPHDSSVMALLENAIMGAMLKTSKNEEGPPDRSRQTSV